MSDSDNIKIPSKYTTRVDKAPSAVVNNRVVETRNKTLESTVIINHKHADKEGEWASWKENCHKNKKYRNWDNCKKSTNIIGILEKYSKNITWIQAFNDDKLEIYENFLDIPKIIQEAKKRVRELFKDREMPEDIYRFNHGSLFRFYGFKRDNIFYSLWHDPKHQIYPVKPKRLNKKR